MDSTESAPQGQRRYLTIIVLVAGVVGGLLFIISVILFCKYCIKRKKGLKRQPAFVKKQSPDRTFKTLRQYESLDSFASHTEYQACDEDEDAEDDDHRAQVTASDKDGEDIDEGNSIDFEVARYRESLKAAATLGVGSSEDVRAQLLSETERESPRSLKETSAGVDENSNGNEEDLRTGRRRVSFQLSTETPTQTCASTPRRYTEGDFHHFKRHKIDKSPAIEMMARHASFGVYSRENSRDIPQEFHPPARITRSRTLSGDVVSNRDSCADASTPMLTRLNWESPSPPNSKPHRTQVAVEVHYQPSNSVNDLKMDASRTSPVIRTTGTPHLLDINYDTIRGKHSHSLEVVSPLDRWSLRDARRAKSYEGELHDYDRQEITQFHRGPFYNADYDVMSEDGSPDTRSKVRYNDTGSFEDVNEDHAEMLDEIVIDSLMVDESDDTETLNGTQKYRELWNLRATFEEEEDLSDTIRMEDLTTSPDQSPDREMVTTSYTTSFESNTEPIICADESGHYHRDHNVNIQNAAKNLLHPNYESRRQSYRNILAKRLEKFDTAGPKSADNSFDSIETVDTDGDVTDTSRPEVTTTSFESTTDNTDSTGDSQTHMLQQMRGDSGYKSLETQQPPAAAPQKKQIHFALEQDSIEADEPPFSPSPEECMAMRVTEHQNGRQNKNGKSYFERRTAKTASKKRREYSRERQIVQVYESVCEPETDSRSDQPSGDSFDENAVPSKYSVFTRFFRSQHKDRMRSQLTRDYSIDEKTDKLFHDFLRQEPEYDISKMALRVRRSPRMHRHRLQRKHTDPCSSMPERERRRDKLVPETRSVSFGSDSSASSTKLLSPQDSIEEEYVRYERVRRSPWDGRRHFDRLPHYNTSTIHEIPIIRLPEEDIAEMRD